MTRHTTIIATATAEAIDAAITQGLQKLKEQHGMSIELVNVATTYRPHNGDIFVTIIAKETGHVAKTIKPKEPKK